MTIRRLATRLAASVPLAFGLLASLAGCDGPRHAPPPIPVTITTSDVSGSYARGQDVTFTFTVTNTSQGALADTSIGTYAPSPSATPVFSKQTVTCSAQTGSCPPLDQNGNYTNVSLAAGAVLTIKIVGTVQIDFDGAIDMAMTASSGFASGSAQADSHVTLADARDGYYVLFGTSGRVASVTVSFKPGDMHWWVSSDNAPVSFQGPVTVYQFANGSHLDTGPDLLHGSYDFGAGPEPFVAVRRFESDLAALDGATFTLFSATPGTGGAARATTVQPAWIAGTTLTICTDAAPRTAATCPAGSQSHYAITTDGSVTLTATDAASGDTFQFFVADTGNSRVLLRGDSDGTSGFFSIGLPAVAAAATDTSYIGQTQGAWSVVKVSSSSYAVAPELPSSSDFAAYGPSAALHAVAGGAAGLLAGTRADGASITYAEADTLAVQIGAPGQFDLFAFFMQ